MVSLSTKLVNFSEAFHSIPIKCVISCDNLIKNISLARKSWLLRGRKKTTTFYGATPTDVTICLQNQSSIGLRSWLQISTLWVACASVRSCGSSWGLLVNKIHLMQLVQHHLDGMTLKPHCQIVDGQPECGWLSRVRSLEFKHLYHLETFKRMTMLLQYHKFTSHQFL